MPHIDTKPYNLVPAIKAWGCRSVAVVADDDIVVQGVGLQQSPEREEKAAARKRGQKSFISTTYAYINI